MTDLDLLHKYILNDPDDDGARLAYADEAEAEGQPERAEFIRAQVELAHAPEPAIKTPGYLFTNLSHEEYSWINCCEGCRYDLTSRTGTLCRYHALRCRERKLLKKHWRAWLQSPTLLYVFPWNLKNSWLRIDVGKWIGLEMRRGFVAHVVATAPSWVAYGDAFCAIHPVEEVTLTSWPLLHGGADGFRFEGRSRIHPGKTHAFLIDRECVSSMLSAEWPRVCKWHLPSTSGVKTCPNG